MMLFTLSATAIHSSYMYIPPLTASTCPVIYAASSDARKHAAAATSSTRAQPAERNLRRPVDLGLLGDGARHVGVDHARARSTFTVMPRDATSRASALAKPISPAFDAA